MTRRFWIGLVAGGAGLRAGDGRHLIGRCTCCSAWPASHWIQFVLATPVVLWAGWPFFARGWPSLVNRSLNMFTLIALGIGAACSSTASSATACARLFPPAFRSGRHGGGLFRGRGGHHGAGAARPGAGTARPRTDLRRHPGAARPGAQDRAAPDAATATRTGVPVEQIVVGDRLRVRPGEKVPVDGVVTGRRSGVDESMVTGESMPVDEGSRRQVIGGTVNGTGGLVMRAEQSRRRHPAGAHRARWSPRRSAAARRSSAWPTRWRAGSCPAVICGGAARFCRLGVVRARAAPGLCAGRCGAGADHRLSLRAGPGDADGDHGRGRARRRRRRSDQECRGAGAAGKGRHAGGGQDRHPDRGQAPAPDRHRVAPASSETDVLRLAASLEARQRTSPGRRPSSRPPATRKIAAGAR